MSGLVPSAPLLLHVYPSFAAGGAQMRFAAIANHFGRRWRHAIVALDGNITCRERLDPTLEVSFPRFEIAGRLPLRLRRIRGVLRELRPQILVTSNWGSIEWTMANVLWPLAPEVHMEDGFGSEEITTQLRRRVLTRRLVLRSATTMLPSRTLLKVATETWRLPPDRLRYIPNGIDLQRFVPVPPADKPELVIGTVAGLRREKNVARLIRAFALVRLPARLVVVGDGPERAALETLADSLGIAERTSFVGHQPDPVESLRALDIFALSSDTEQMPLSLLEAMASGLPVAATDVGDVRAMLPPEGHPYLVPRDDQALADVLAVLLENPEARLRAGTANRMRAVRDFDQARMFAAYAELFSPAAGARHEGDAPKLEVR